MFGYVKPFRPELRICEYETWRAVYCGLCGQLGHSYGPAARLTLSYDFTFLAMLDLALSGEKPEFSRRRCFVNPLKKVPVCLPGRALGFSADTAAIMIYYKLMDNLNDEGLPVRAGCAALYPPVRVAWRKAAGRQPECETAIAACIQSQKALEADHCDSVDLAAEPTALAMSGMCRLLSKDEVQQRVLERFGYFLGRYVYLCDALDDLEKDAAAGKYNPWVLRHGLTRNTAAGEREPVLKSARESLYGTIAEAGSAFALLDLRMFRPVLENVVQIGMRASVDEILARKEKTR